MGATVINDIAIAFFIATRRVLFKSSAEIS